MTTKTEIINKNTQLVPGDQIKLTFKWLTNWSWLQAAQLALIENRLKNKYEAFEIIRYEWLDDGVAVDLKILKPPALDPMQNRQEAGLTGAIIAVAILGVSLVYWLSLDKTEKLIDSPAVKIGSAAVLVLAVAYLILVWRKK